ncbi:alpha-amylase family glycosyl hydrolase [Hymenobacter psoromatis]|nr:alpha-amylase family glycosyl hydrolase [Hymenobacter psoromatis]
MKPRLRGQWLLALLLVLGWASAAQAQVTANPTPFTDATPVTLTYDATQGNAALNNFAGDVYIWTGVVTSSATGTGWTYVKSPTFGQADPAAKMTRSTTNPNLYTITFTPRTFYGVPAGTPIYRLGMIFKDAAGATVGRTTSGGDIFVDVAQDAFNLRFASPGGAPPYYFPQNTATNVTVTTNTAATITLFLNDVQVAQQANVTTLTAPVTLTAASGTLKATATSGANTATIQAAVQAYPPVTVAALPAGAKADGITYINGGTSAILTLTAPRKQFVYVVGDFNNWQPTAAGFMQRTTAGSPTSLSDPASAVDAASGRWWVQVDGLTPGTEYAYQFLVDGQLHVADSYCGKILDPGNDAGIPASTYPSLVAAYPTGKATGIVSVLQPGKAAYTWTVTNFQRPARPDMVIYELLVRDFVAAHDYNTLRDTLNYIQRLGANVIELMPINEFDNNESWGYNPSFYFAPDKYYGTQDALKAFIDECHRRGIAVVLDMVLNHSTGNSPMVQLYGDISSGPTADNPWFNTMAPHPYSVYNDLNHESPYTRLFSKNVIQFWLQEYHVDGYRFDLAGGFSQVPKTEANYSDYDQSRINIWKDYYTYQMSVDNTSYPILEHFPNYNADPTKDEGKVLADYGMMLWDNQNYNYTQAAMGYDQGWDLSYGYYGNQGGRGWNEPNAVTYMESHDEERMQFKNITYGNSSGGYTTKDPATGLKRDELAAALFFTQPGPRLVWQFGEVGYDISIDQNGRTGDKPILWNYYQEPNRRHLFDTYRALIALKKQPAFAAPTAYVQNLSGPVKTISLTGADLSVVSYGNFGVVATTATVNFPAAGTWYNYLDGTQLNVTSAAVPLSLQPGQYAVYTSRKLTVPAGTTLATRAPQTAAFDLSLVPNPAAGTTTLTYALPTAATATIAVQNLLGQTIRQLPAARQAAGAQAQALPLLGLAPGVYLVRLQADGQTQTARLLVQ